MQRPDNSEELPAYVFFNSLIFFSTKTSKIERDEEGLSRKLLGIIRPFSVKYPKSGFQ